MKDKGFNRIKPNAKQDKLLDEEDNSEFNINSKSFPIYISLKLQEK